MRVLTMVSMNHHRHQFTGGVDMKLHMRFKIDGDWKEMDVETVSEFTWEGMNFVLHHNIDETAKYRVSHKESGMLVWAGDKTTQTKEIAIGLMDQATRGGVAKSILKELGV